MYNKYKILTAVLTLALVTMACGLNRIGPVTKIQTGSLQGVEIQVPMPAGTSTGTELTLEFVGGELKLAPGATDYLASGMASFNAADFQPAVESSGSGTTVRTGQEIEGIPVFDKEVVNKWDLQLANTPMSLMINAGAYDGSFELGGLSLEKLAISDGGANVTCAFSTPNNVEMSTFTYSTGASTAILKGLANANFEQMSFNSGAGTYTLSFDGNLQRDANVTIESGVGSVTVIVPEEVNAKVTIDGLLTVNASGAWVQNDKVYTLSGSGPALTIIVKMGAGTLNLKTE